MSPFGDERADWRAALLATTTLNASGHVDQPAEMDGFLLRFDGDGDAGDELDLETKIRATFGRIMGAQQAGGTGSGGK